MFILSQSDTVQNLSSLTLKTKELWKGVENIPLPSAKKPCAYRVKNRNFGYLCGPGSFDFHRCLCETRKTAICLQVNPGLKTKRSSHS